MCLYRWPVTSMSYTMWQNVKTMLQVQHIYTIWRNRIARESTWIWKPLVNLICLHTFNFGSRLKIFIQRRNLILHYRNEFQNRLPSKTITTLCFHPIDVGHSAMFALIKERHFFKYTIHLIVISMSFHFCVASTEVLSFPLLFFKKPGDWFRTAWIVVINVPIIIHFFQPCTTM